MSNILIETINTILPTLLIKYIPIDDISTRSLLAYPLSKLIVSLITFLFELVSNIINFMPLHYFQKKYIILDNTMLYYKAFSKYIINNHLDKIKACKTIQEDYNTNFEALEFYKTTIIDIFEKDNKKYKMYINIANDKSYKISSNNIELIQEYIKNIYDRITLTCDNFDLVIFKPQVTINTEKNIGTFNSWNKNVSKTNKRLINTILSDSVNENFVEKIKTFLTKSQLQIHNEKGLPYKIGFLLHGEPGTGKTSIIKSVAVEYNLPIFSFSLDVINTTNMVNVANEMIYKYIKPGTPHIVAIEDIDTTNFACRNSSENIQISTLLQLLDGIDEYHGRITIMTANNISYLNNNPSLIRPGRIDNIIHVTYCDENQIRGILKLHYGPIIESLIIEKDIIITSASLIQIITIIKDLDLVIKYLNETKNFNKINSNKLNDLITKFIEKQNNPNINEIEKTETEIQDTGKKSVSDYKFDIIDTQYVLNVTINGERYYVGPNDILYYNLVIMRDLYKYNINKYNEMLKILEEQAVDTKYLASVYNLDIDDAIADSNYRFREYHIPENGNMSKNWSLVEIANMVKQNKYNLIKEYKKIIYKCIINLENLENLLLILRSYYNYQSYKTFDHIFENLCVENYFGILARISDQRIIRQDFAISVNNLCNYCFYHIDNYNTQYICTYLGPCYFMFAPYFRNFFDYKQLENVYNIFFNPDGTKKIKNE